MANWGNTKISKDDGVKIVSHERVLDTNPETYRERGRICLAQGEYKEAEKAYLLAMRWAGQNDDDLEKLFTVYYRSRDKTMEAKANNLFDAWWWRKDINKVVFYAVFCGMTILLGLTGMTGQLLAGLLYLAAIWLVFARMINQKKLFAFGARLGDNIIGGSFVYAIWIVIKMVALGIAFALVSNSSIGVACGNALETLESLPFVRLAEKLIGAVCGIVFLYSFHKGISVLQSMVSRWETEFFRKLFGFVLLVARIAGTIVAFVVSYDALVNNSLELVENVLRSV